MREIVRGRMIGEPLDVERRKDLSEVVRMQPQLGSEYVVVLVVEVIPETRGREQIDATGAKLSGNECVADLRAQRDQHSIRDQLRGVRLGEGVVADQRSQAVREDDIGLLAFDRLGQAPFASRAEIRCPQSTSRSCPPSSGCRRRDFAAFGTAP